LSAANSAATFTTTNDLSPCFQAVVLQSIPAAFLIILGSLQLRRVLRVEIPGYSVPKLHFRTTVVVQTLLALLALVSIVRRLINRELWPYNFVERGFNAAAWLYGVLITRAEERRHLMYGRVVRVFW
jgi:hypothetical protein